MKNWLSALLKAKENQCASTTQVLECFSPLLKAAAAFEKKSEVDLLGDLLWQSLVSLFNGKDDQSKVELLRTVEVDKVPTVPVASGSLDALNDNCLGHALAFLGFKDRCNSLERTCHRLFHVSRTTPIHKTCFDYMRSELRLTHKQSLLLISRRFVTRHLDFARIREFLHLPFFDTISHFRRQLRRICVDTRSIAAVRRLTFPQLISVDLMDCDDMNEICSFISAQPKVYRLNVYPRIDCETLRRLCALKCITKLILGRDLCDGLVAPIDCDFGHVLQLTVESGSTICKLSRSFASLKCLRVHEISNTTDCQLELPSLERVQLVQSRFSFEAVKEFFDALKAPVIGVFELTSHWRTFPLCVENCKAPALQWIPRGNFCKEKMAEALEYFPALCEALHSADNLCALTLDFSLMGNSTCVHKSVGRYFAALSEEMGGHWTFVNNLNWKILLTNAIWATLRTHISREVQQKLQPFVEIVLR